MMYNEYPFQNNDSDRGGTPIPLDQSQYQVGPAYQPEEQVSSVPGEKRKKKGRGKIAAVCLACVFGVGVIAAGTALILNANDARQATVQVGQREPVQLNTVQVNTGEKMTLPEVYAANVNATVGISTEVTATNVFGQQVSGVASGSGFVISESGYIITNYHVVEDAKTITVTMYDETKYTAALVGYDADNDIAVLKVDAADLQAVTLGDSSKMNVGESVMAIGNPLGELTFTYTTGIISALNRAVTVSGTSYNMIQTDCAINEGNSGGPLFNEYGEVIGIVSAKYASSEIEGLGFAIPMNDVLDLIQDIMANGRVTGKPSMGITVSTVSEAVAQQYNLPVGACVNNVTVGSCAEKAGLKQGDIIIKINDTDIASSNDLSAAKKNFKAGETVTLTVYRSGETLTLELTFDEESQTTAGEESAENNTAQGQMPNNGNGGYYYYNPFSGGGFGY